MAKHKGVWIDHNQAHVVTLGGRTGPEVRTISSGAEGHHKASGTAGVTAPAHLHGAPTHKYERRRQQELDRYYAAVVAALADADAIVVLGPKPARDEFRKALEQDASLATRLLAVEAADKLTEPQLIAQVEKLMKERLESRGHGRGPATAPVPRELARHGLRPPPSLGAESEQ